MTIPQEIEQLKTQLAQTKDEQVEAKVILELLKKYASINSPASQSYIDRLLFLAEKMNAEHYRAWGLFYLAFINRLNGEYDVAGNLSQKALSIFERLNDLNGMANAYTTIGKLYHERSNHAEAMKNFLLALKIREKIGDKPEIAASIGHIGIIHILQGNYPEALKNILRSLQIMEEIGDKRGMAMSYNNIGLIHFDQDNYPEALKNLVIGLQLREEIGDKEGVGASFSNIGIVYQKQGNYSEALKNYMPAIQIMEEIGYKREIAGLQINIGVIRFNQRDYPEALKNYLAALEISKEIGSKDGVSHCYNNIGELYEKLENHADALKNKLLAHQFAEEIDNKSMIKDISRSLANSYKAINDFENALKYYEEYHRIESEILGEQAQKQLTGLNFQHNMEQKEKEAEINRLRNVELKGALDHLQIEKDNSERLLLNILPAEVAEELKVKGTADAKMFDDVTVLYTDFVGFTKVSMILSPQQLVDELHKCFSAFDEIMEKHNIEKIKTVGDAYLAVSGLPLSNTNHAYNVVSAALEIREFMLNRRTQLIDKTFEIRIGVHSGSVVAGIVGIKKFAYDIWGDTVNTAARMEQNSETGRVNISQTTYDLVGNKFSCMHRGKIAAKNKGEVDMYFVEWLT